MLYHAVGTARRTQEVNPTSAGEGVAGGLQPSQLEKFSEKTIGDEGNFSDCS